VLYGSFDVSVVLKTANKKRRILFCYTDLRLYKTLFVEVICRNGQSIGDSVSTPG